MSVRSNDSITFDLISNANGCVRLLRASQGSASERGSRSESKRQASLDLAVGALYCLEYQFGMDVSLANTICRPFEAPSATSEDYRVRWMTSQVEYIRLCLRIAKPPENENDRQVHIHTLEGEVQVWKSNLPGQYHDIDQPYPRNIASDNRKLWLFCQYHEASLRLHMSHIGDAFEALESDSEHAVCSAKVILEATSLLPPSAVLSNR